MAYSSMRFTEQLNRHIDAFPELDHSKMQSEDHTIDIQKRTVVKRQHKKYKFDANELIKIGYQVTFVNVSPSQLTLPESIPVQSED
jgi:hypothetical protein